MTKSITKITKMTEYICNTLVFLYEVSKGIAASILLMQFIFVSPCISLNTGLDMYIEWRMGGFPKTFCTESWKEKHWMTIAEIPERLQEGHERLGRRTWPKPPWKSKHAGKLHFSPAIPQRHCGSGTCGSLAACTTRCGAANHRVG